jgi:tripartite-type tricarboxylate transporter receptor subunit TctC
MDAANWLAKRAQRLAAALNALAPFTTKAVVSKIIADVNSILRHADVREKLLGKGFLPAVPGTPEEFGKFIGDEGARYGKLIKAAGIEPSR